MSDQRYSRSFKAIDGAGNEYQIDEYVAHSTKRLLDGSLDDSTSRVKDLRTPNGRKVTPLKGNQLQIPSGNGPIIVTTNDPEYLRSQIE